MGAQVNPRQVTRMKPISMSVTEMQPNLRFFGPDHLYWMDCLDLALTCTHIVILIKLAGNTALSKFKRRLGEVDVLTERES